MSRYIKLSLALSALLMCARTIDAQEKGPAFWLDWATEETARIKLDLDDSWDGAYLSSTLHFRLALAELRAKRPDKAKARLEQIIQNAESVINDPRARPGDQPFPAWTHGYVHGLGAVIRVAEIPAAPAKLSREHELHAAAVEAHAHIAVGDQASYQEVLKTWWRLTIDEDEMRDARARKVSYLHLGQGAAWELARLARRIEDKDLLGILTAPGWKDRAETLATKAIFTQTTLTYSDHGFSDRVLEGYVIKGFQKVQDQYADRKAEPARRTHHDNGPGDSQFGYNAGLNGSLAEAVAAIWVIRGRAEALTFGRKNGEPKGPWRFPAAIHAATMLRESSQAKESSEALDYALQLRLGEGETPAPADVQDLARELTRQGRAEDVQRRLVRVHDDPASRCSAAIGIAMGIMDQR